jgi:alkanesulfonate monooxygenase SsuD/methylene tetrahydromethanopterin reductase-like flavin-dependent oxidoreductase (luciferase family)
VPVAVGWLREEYQLLGVDFASRGRRLDELLEVSRKFWSGVPVAHRGEFFEFEEGIMCPAPRLPVPVWCGGAVPAALRRAARNDGWLGLPLDRATAVPVLQTLRNERQAAGLPRGISRSTSRSPRRMSRRSLLKSRTWASPG